MLESSVSTHPVSEEEEEEEDVSLELQHADTLVSVRAAVEEIIVPHLNTMRNNTQNPLHVAYERALLRHLAVRCAMLTLNRSGTISSLGELVSLLARDLFSLRIRI